MEPIKVYLAAPFFNEEQITNLEKVESLCKKNKLEYLSPRKFFVLEPKASWDDRQKVFHSNLAYIGASSLVLACIDDKDTGTTWEMGYAYAIRKPVVAYSYKNKIINVMLAQSCKGFIKDYVDLNEFLRGHFTGYQGADIGNPWDFNWEVTQKWLQNIY